MNVLSQDKRDAIAENAAKIFLSRGIEATTIRDIARSSGVGEATLYRHYKTKVQLAILAAEYLQKEIFASYFVSPSSGSGFADLCAFYDVFVQVYNNHPEYYRFLDEFDVFVSKANDGDKASYELGISRFEDVYFAFYRKGRDDGSVAELDDVQSFYFASTHATISLCKKLASESVIRQDLRIDKSKELKVFIETILYRLEKK